jgi:hypothetical protein
MVARPTKRRQPDSYDHFTPIVQRLAADATAFGGSVLLLDGDSHVFTDDHPLADPAARPPAVAGGVQLRAQRVLQPARIRPGVCPGG